MPPALPGDRVMSTPTPAPGGTAVPERVPRKAALASFVGSMLEYYDFFIYGAAAGLVFPTVFFADSDPATATLLSLATFGVAYVARPIGAVIIGHFGDKLFSWGWRVPFFLSLVVVAVGYWVRRTLPETPEFEKVEQADAVAKLPVAVLFRDHWASVIRVVLCALVSVGSSIVA